MASLLIQSCSATKKLVDTAVPAIDLYDGYFFRIIKKAMREGRFSPNIDILILSAKHGVVEPDDVIDHYDRRMNRERAKELNADVVKDVSCKAKENSYDKVWINMGKEYESALDDIEENLDVAVERIEGDGIGVKGKRLKELVSTGQSMTAVGV